MKMINRYLTASTLLFSFSAQAGVILDWEGTGVDFYSSWLDADTLRIEIDAANPSTGWANAVNIDSIAINAPDAWSWVNTSDITLSGPGSFGGPVDGTGLSNGQGGGCGSLALGANHQCWSGLAALTDDMFFDFTFTGDAEILTYTDSPHLKVRFIDANGKKSGSLLSTNVHSVPEPTMIALMGAGLVGLGFVRRKVRT